VGAVCVPKPGEDTCGDAWSVAAGSPECLSVLVADGLGHGPGAADAARLAVRVFEAHPGRTPGAHLSAIHEALRSTRGAGAAVASIDRRSGTVTFAGVGNVAGAIVARGRSRQLVSMNGTLGHKVHRINEFTYPWDDDALLVMHSDGLTSRWDLDRYPGLGERHPSLVAGVLFRDFQRVRDDVTVVAVRVRRT
jgi:serine/threonine protein phosphatase PrpC